VAVIISIILPSSHSISGCHDMLTSTLMLPIKHAACHYKFHWQ
jgi:hypothetical protein